MTKDGSPTFQVRFKLKGDERVALKIDFGDEESQSTEGTDDPAQTVSSSFEELSRRWTNTAIGFFEIVPILSEIGTVAADHEIERGVHQLVREVSQETKKETSDDGDFEVYEVPLREAARVTKQLHEGRRFLETAIVVKRSALTALLAEYEALILEVATLAAQVRPEAFLGGELTLSVDDFSDFDSLDELKAEFLSKKIDDFLHGTSHTEVLKKTGKMFGVDLLSDNGLISEFTEICQRRHLISHAGSKANKRYVRVCSQAGCDQDLMLGLGQTVTVDRKYLRRATARVFQVGFFTLHLIWQKLLQKPSESDKLVLTASHEFLERDLTKMARRVVNFSLSRKNRAADRSHAYLIINKAQSFKFDKGLDPERRIEGMEGVLKERDWSESSSVTQLALACLRDNFALARSLLPLAAKQSDQPLLYSDIFTWNIFREAREDSEFIAGVEEAFGLTLKLPKDEDKKLIENKSTD